MSFSGRFCAACLILVAGTTGCTSVPGAGPGSCCGSTMQSYPLNAVPPTYQAPTGGLPTYVPQDGGTGMAPAGGGDAPPFNP